MAIPKNDCQKFCREVALISAVKVGINTEQKLKLSNKPFFLYLFSLLIIPVHITKKMA